MPNRILKESICTSESIEKLSFFEEVFFYRLIVNCDDYGRMDARPAVLKARLFTLKDRITLKEVAGALRVLADVGIVRLYECDGKPYLYLPSWEVHQTIRAKKSRYPQPPAEENSNLHAHESICKQMISDVPVIQSNTNPNPNTIRESESEARACAHKETAATGKSGAVIADFLNRINPSASKSCLEKLAAYAEELGPDVCMRAFDIALDSKKATWPYIQAILQDKSRNGVRCLADWDAFDKGGKPSGKNQTRQLDAEEREAIRRLMKEENNG